MLKSDTLFTVNSKQSVTVKKVTKVTQKVINN